MTEGIINMKKVHYLEEVSGCVAKYLYVWIHHNHKVATILRKLVVVFLMYM